ncbi:hypothetical protein KM043_009446 [Ampulex compressa]|nr:hypothetical protein KM043_009446 [Ampulex compressa]
MSGLSSFKSVENKVGANFGDFASDDPPSDLYPCPYLSVISRDALRTELIYVLPGRLVNSQGRLGRPRLLSSLLGVRKPEGTSQKFLRIELEEVQPRARYDLVIGYSAIDSGRGNPSKINQKLES